MADLRVIDLLREDLRCVFERDPAARRRLDVIACYAGFHAVVAHRLAHQLWRRERFFGARLLAHLARLLTGVEIHPAARIGRRFFIDHGFGVVIGETAEIGDDVTLFQGVTLGGTSVRREKRHPTLESEVVVGAGAVILGRVRIGRGARIGAGSVVVRDVPPAATVVGVPGRVVRGDAGAPAAMEHGDLPDVVRAAIEGLRERVAVLEDRLVAEGAAPAPNALGTPTEDERDPALSVPLASDADGAAPAPGSDVGCDDG